MAPDVAEKGQRTSLPRLGTGATGSRSWVLVAVPGSPGRSAAVKAPPRRARAECGPARLGQGR